MKKIFLIVVLFFCMIFSFAQHVPQGMKYQAVARNLSGNIIANQEIYLKIDLLTTVDGSSTIYYSETHTVTTNQLGLFTLAIGEGNIEKGAFSNIPWSTADIWMQVAIKEKNKSDFVPISNSKLLAVPYAFHSETANALAAGHASAAKTSDALTDYNSTDVCDCKEGLGALKVLYLGNSNVDIKVYSDKSVRQLLFSFPQVKNGDLLNLAAASKKEITSTNLF